MHYELVTSDQRQLKIRGITSMDRNGVIGYKNDLIFNNSEDLQHFKQMTMGHTIVMGWKTFESMKHRILPGRQTVIMTRPIHINARKEFVSKLSPPDNTPEPIIISKVDELIPIAESRNDISIYVIGGAKIFNLFYYHIMNWIITVYRTSVETSGVDLGLLPKDFSNKDLVVVEELKGIGTHYVGLLGSGTFKCPSGASVRYAIGSYRPYAKRLPKTTSNLYVDEDPVYDPYRY